MLAGLYCMIMLGLSNAGMELVMTKFNILDTWGCEHITKRLQLADNRYDVGIKLKRKLRSSLPHLYVYAVL